MKKNLKFFISAALLSALSATLSAQSIYLAEANRNPFERTVFIDNKGETFRYTAFYQGTRQPQGDIQVNFSVDAAKVAAYNTKHGTVYKIMPKGSYTLGMSSAVIAKGSVSAAPGEVKVTGKGFLKAGQTYMLPVTVGVNSILAIADQELSTVYYIITAAPAPGEVARKQIGRLPSGTKSVFGLGGKYLIAAGTGGTVSSYRYTGGSLGQPTTVSVPDNLKEMAYVINFRDHHIIGHYQGAAGGQLLSFPISADGKTVGAMEKVFGTAGFNIFSEIIPVGVNLYCRKPSGELMLYPLTESLEWAPSGTNGLGSGWNHPVIFGYGKALIAIDKDGVMWRYPILENGQLHLAKKIGTGWNIYDRIVVMGNDLLCVDKEGAVWQIKFDDKKYWAL